MTNSARQANTAVAESPSGVQLVRTLRGHEGFIARLAWSADGNTLASPSEDKTIRLWNAETGECLRKLAGHENTVWSVAFDRGGRTLASVSEDKTIRMWDVASGQFLCALEGHKASVECVTFDRRGRTLASGSGDRTVMLWDVASWQLLRTLEGHRNPVDCIAFDSTGHRLASGSRDTTVKVWDVAAGRLIANLEGHRRRIHCVAFDPITGVLATGSADRTIKLWNPSDGRLLRTLEGHTDEVRGIAFLHDERLIASSGDDATIRIWSSDTADCVAVIPERRGRIWGLSGLTCHPLLPRFATVVLDPDAPQDELHCAIHIRDINIDLLLAQNLVVPSSHYVNAKVVLLGDTGVGKSGLSLVLNGKPFEPTDSTPGRKVWVFQSENVLLAPTLKQTRETLLWDLAGQPGYRVIHQLHLNEVALALLVFDARSETDPLAGVRHWERALRLAQQRRTGSSIPIKKFLISARNDRGTPSVSKDRLRALLNDFAFDAYFETSAKEGWQINELRQAVEKAIPWHLLPEVSSTLLFTDIKNFLMDVKLTGRLITPATRLYEEFAAANPSVVEMESDLREQFDTCIGRLENRDLIRRLSFGDYVLLQPELLDAYASAMVNTAKGDPDGLGSIAEDAAIEGKFFVPGEQRITDSAQEQLLLHATVEELVRHDLALRESAADGRYLVFPSQFNRDYEAVPEPRGTALAVTFDGPVQSLYSTLAVRLGHSGLFTTGRSEMWRNAAIFTAKAGGKCGIYVHEFAEARGRVAVFYRDHLGIRPHDETRFHFEQFVLAHIRRHALDGSVEIVGSVICPTCGDPVPDSYVKRLRDKSLTAFNCPCGAVVPLQQPPERLHFDSKVEAMERSADGQRDFESFVMSARGETRTRGFTEWVGDERVTLAIVFTDIVGSTALGEEIGDEPMNAVRRAHFAQSRSFIKLFDGREIKTIGDSFMAAFHSVARGLDYAKALQAKSGHPRVKVRVGIHIGQMRVEENDVFGGTVNFAARVVASIKGAEIWLSDRAKMDMDKSVAANHQWARHDGVEMKGFKGAFTLWALADEFNSISSDVPRFLLKSPTPASPPQPRPRDPDSSLPSSSQK